MRACVDDWRAMRDRVAEAIETYRANPPPLPTDEVAEASQFLEWMCDDNFTFSACANTASRPTATPRPTSSTARPRHAARSRRARAAPRPELVVMTPEIRAFLPSRPALIITKANVKSRVHRRVHLDYIGVKLFTADGRLEGELRIVGLFTSNAYTALRAADALSAPQGREGAAARRLRPGELCRPRAAPMLEEYPRDELFQIDEETLYRFALEILQAVPSGRASARSRGSTSSTASSRCSSSCRRTATTPRSAARRRIPGADLRGPAVGGLSGLSRKGRSRAPTTSSAATRARRRVVERATLEAGIGAIVRTWGDACKEALAAHRRLRGAHARGALCRRLQRRLSRGLRRDRGDRRHRDPRAAHAGAAAGGQRLPPRGRRPTTRVNLKVFSRGAPLPLSERVPLLENLGFRVVNERTYASRRARSRRRRRSGCTT